MRGLEFIAGKNILEFIAGQNSLGARFSAFRTSFSTDDRGNGMLAPPFIWVVPKSIKRLEKICSGRL